MSAARITVAGPLLHGYPHSTSASVDGVEMPPGQYAESVQDGDLRSYGSAPVHLTPQPSVPVSVPSTVFPVTREPSALDPTTFQVRSPTIHRHASFRGSTGLGTVHTLQPSSLDALGHLPPTITESFHNPEVEAEKLISLHRVILDAYEFHGLNVLLWSVIFFIIATLALYAQWGGIYSNAAAFTSTAAESMKVVLCGPGFQQLTGQQPITLEEVSSMAFGVDYATGYVICATAHSAGLDLQNPPPINPATERSTEEIRVGQFGRVMYMRFQVAVCQNWEERAREFDAYEGWRYAECDTKQWNSTYNNSYTSMVNNGYPHLSDLWLRPNYTSDSNEYVLEVYSTNKKLTLCDVQRRMYAVGFPRGISQNIETRWDTLQDLYKGNNLTLDDCSDDVTAGESDDTVVRQLVGDRDFIGSYATQFKLQVVAENILGSTVYRAYFTLTIQYGVLNNHKVVTQIATAALPHPQQWQVLAFMILFLLCTVWYTYADFRVFRLCWIQHQSLGLYFQYWWNWIVLLSQSCNWVWVLWYFIEYPNSQPAGANSLWPPVNSAQMDQWEQRADTFTIFLHFGVMVIFLLGIRIMRFMRVHLGMRALYFVFIDVFNHIVDFAVFALYLMLVLGVLTFASFQISGGNPLFVDFPDGLSAMARLAFGFLDYETFYNYALGLNAVYAFTRSGVFWLSVVCLTVFMTNMIIAIFNDAYARAQRRVLRVEHSFIKLVVLRLVFFFFYYFWLFPRTVMGKLRQDNFWPEGATDDEGMVPVNWHQRLHQRVHKTWDVLVQHRFHVYPLLLERPGEPEVTGRSVKLLFARWTIAKLVDMQALTAYYTDYATLKAGRANGWSWGDAGGPIWDGKQAAEAVPELNAIVDRAALESLVAATLRKSSQISKLHSKWWWRLLWINPFRSLNSLTIEHLQNAIMEVYRRVPAPVSDVDETDVGVALAGINAQVRTTDEALQRQNQELREQLERMQSRMDQLLGLLQQPLQRR